MTQDGPVEYYEVLQVSSVAEPETIHRVYRLLAQRFHPDNRETGDPERFRQLRAAYDVLSDPERRAQYDIAYHQMRHSRWRSVTAEGVHPETDFGRERITRLTVLEVLYARRRLEPQEAGIFPGDLEDLLGQPREHLTFTFWYLSQKGLTRSDNSRLMITVEGVDYLEENYQQNARTRQLRAHNIEVKPAGESSAA